MANREDWLNLSEFAKRTGWGKLTVMGYANKNKVERRGKPRSYEYLYTGQKRKPNTGRPKNPLNDVSVKPDSVFDKLQEPSALDKRVKNIAWLAQRCLSADISFTDSLDEIIGEYRARL